MGKFNTAFYIFKHDRNKLGLALINNFYKCPISHWLSDRSYLKLQFRLISGKKLNLRQPKGFNEKLNWLKLHDRNPKYTQLVDKAAVKEYVADIIGEQYVIPTLGVYDRVEDIDFASLPDQYVLKCTHDSGSVCICRDKRLFDVGAAKAKLKHKMNTNLFWMAREWPYKNLKPRILAEKYMDFSSQGKGIIDYKFFCFNGEPRFIYVSQGLENHSTARISYVSMDWKKEEFYRDDFQQFEELPPRPHTFDKMVEFAKIFSKDKKFLRVDFYEIEEKLYFGELTFYPGAGYTFFHPEDWERKIGDMLKID